MVGLVIFNRVPSAVRTPYYGRPYSGQLVSVERSACTYMLSVKRTATESICFLKIAVVYSFNKLVLECLKNHCPRCSTVLVGRLSNRCKICRSMRLTSCRKLFGVEGKRSIKPCMPRWWSCRVGITVKPSSYHHGKSLRGCVNAGRRCSSNR